MAQQEGGVGLSDKELNISNASMLGSESQAVKTLPGFVKRYHQNPKAISAYHESWIQKIAQSFLDDQMDEAVRFFNESLNYKRRDLNVQRSDKGEAMLQTKDFDFSLTMTQSQDKADLYLLTRRVFNFKNREIIYKDAFNQWFSNGLNELRFDLDQTVPIGDIIDRVEDYDKREDISVNYRITDLSDCTIVLQGVDGTLFCQARSFSIVLDTAVSPDMLVEQAQKALDRLAEIGVKGILGQA